jgi:predicted TIM-barrel fold metal-dependent hydrolase
MDYDGPLFDGHLHAAGPLAHAPGLLKNLQAGALGRSITRAVLIAAPVSHRGARYARHIPGVYQRTFGTWRLGKQLSWRLIGLVARNLSHQPDNALVARLVAAAPDRLVGFAFVNPAAPTALEDARHWIEHANFSGLKLHGWFHRVPLLSDQVLQLAAYAGQHRLPVLLHPGLGRRRREMLDELARQYPATPFIVAHLDEDALEVAAHRDNVFLDTAGLPMTPRHLSRALRLVGAGKLIFGSDSPRETGGDLAHSLRLLDHARLRRADLERICWGTLHSLLPTTAAGWPLARQST